MVNCVPMPGDLSHIPSVLVYVCATSFITLLLRLRQITSRRTKLVGHGYLIGMSPRL
jgi:hypothetical protein